MKPWQERFLLGFGLTLLIYVVFYAFLLYLFGYAASAVSFLLPFGAGLGLTFYSYIKIRENYYFWHEYPFEDGILSAKVVLVLAGFAILCFSEKIPADTSMNPSFLGYE